jgi:hypothetical protein
MKRHGNGVSAVTQLWKPMSIRTPEDGGSAFSETSVRNMLHSIKSQKTYLIDTAVKASKKTDPKKTVLLEL